MTHRISAWVTLTSLSAVLSCNRWTEHEQKHQGHDEHQEQGEGHEGHEDGEHHAGAPIQLGPELLQQITIRTAPAQRRHVVDALTLPAEVRPHPDRIAHITPLVSSQVSEVKVQPGDRVEKGQVLASLKSVQLGEARAQIAQAQAALDVAMDQLTRQEQLMGAGIGAQKSYVEAQAAVKQAEAGLSAAHARAQVYGGSGGSGSTTLLRSPLAGTVVERHATAGEIASPEQELFVIADIDPVWVIGRAYESDLAHVTAGMNARIQVNAFPERTWEGSIAYVSPTLEERTRTAEVRVELANTDAALKPGMFATLVPLAPTSETDGPAGLAVPSSAVQRDGQRLLAFVALGEGRFEPRVIQIGKRGGEYVEVREGLSEGELVVTEGTFILKSEAAKHQMGGGHSH